MLAADEAVTNIMRHTYQGAPDKPIMLSGNITDGHLHLRLRDQGPHVDFAAMKGRELDDIKPGGLGLHLLRASSPSSSTRSWSPPATSGTSPSAGGLIARTLTRTTAAGVASR